MAEEETTEEQEPKKKSPILMIEDAHENAGELIRSLDSFLKAGDYLVIEDTLDQKKYNSHKDYI